MKKFYALGMLLSYAFCNAAVTNQPLTLPAATATPVKQTNIGVATAQKTTTNEMPYVIVDVQKVILDTTIDKEPVENLMKFQQSKQQELQNLGQSIQNKEKDLQNKASVMAPESLKKQQEEIEELRQSAQLKLQRANNEVREEEMKTRANVFQSVQTYAQQWADSNPQVDIVFERNGGILAISNRVDKTGDLSEIIKKDLAKKEAMKKKAAPKANEPVKAAAK